MSTLSLDTAAQLYNPSFDPLVDQGVGQAMAYAPTYWVASAGTPPENDGAITHDLDADVVIVGGGFTGLATVGLTAGKHSR